MSRSYLSTIKMQWVVNEYRKDRRTGAIQPVKASDYYKELAKEGAGSNVGGQPNNGVPKGD